MIQNTGAIAHSVIDYGLPIILLTLCACGITWILCRIYNQHSKLNNRGGTENGHR